MSREQAIFAAFLANRYSLPLTDETNGLICYNEPVPDLTCDPLTPVMGVLQSDEAGLHPTADQCYKLLKAEWPYVTYWFGEIFPNFHPPDTSDYGKYMLKTVLWLWILQYGPGELRGNELWQNIVTTFNNDSLDWTQLFAWMGDLKGFNPDGSATFSFPAVLEASLTETSPEMQLFNYFSEVCASPCSLGVQCRQLYGSECGCC
jgi:hypothetical protein